MAEGQVQMGDEWTLQVNMGEVKCSDLVTRLAWVGPSL